MAKPGVWHGLTLLALVAALVTAALVYWQGLTGPFLLDDQYNIPPAKISSLTWAHVRNVALANESGPLRRPLSVLTFMLNHHIGGSAPIGFKYVNLMLHLLTAVLIFWLGGRLLPPVAAPGETQTRLWIVSGAAAFLWAVHPLHISTVLYAVQRMAILASIFSLAALLCYALARERLIDGRGGVSGPAAWLAVFAALAVLSKESGALIPFFILAVEVAVFRFRSAREIDRRKLRALLAVFCVVPVGIGLLYFATHTDSLLGEYSVREFSLLDRLITQPGVLWFYVKLILLPDIAKMSVFHDDYPVAALGLLSTLQILSIPAALAAAFILRHRLPVVTFGLLWFLAAHLMESTVLPLELVFEHRNYLAAYGLLLPVVYALIPRNLASLQRQLRVLFYGCAAALLCFQTYTRSVTWSNAGLLASITVQEHPHSARAHHNYGMLLGTIGEHERSLEAARRAERLNPNNTGYTTAVLLGECTLDRVQPDTIERLRYKLASQPINTHTATNLNQLLEATVRNYCDGLDAHSFLKLARGAAEYAETETQARRRAAGFTYYGIALSQFPDRRSEAIETFRKAFDADPSNIGPLVAIGQLQASDGRLTDARETLKQAEHHNQRHITDRSSLLVRLEKRLERLETAQ